MTREEKMIKLAAYKKITVEELEVEIVEAYERFVANKMTIPEDMPIIMKKVLIISGSDMYYTGDGKTLSGQERLAERVEKFINDHEVLEVHYSSSYAEGICSNTNYSVMIIYEVK